MSIYRQEPIDLSRAETYPIASCPSKAVLGWSGITGAKFSRAAKLKPRLYLAPRTHSSKLCAFGWLAHSRNSRLRLFTEGTQIAGAQSLWPSPYFFACFTKFGRTFVRLY